MDAGRHQRPHLLEPVVERAGADPRGQLGVVAQPSERRRSAWASARPGSRASSRSSIRSALAATRAWNASRPSVPVRTSPSTHSRTASSSSAMVGRSCTRRRRRLAGRGPALERRPGEQAEHVPLVLAHPPADGGQLHRAGRAAQVAPRLHDAHHAPLEGAERLPPAQGVEVDRPAAGRLVGRRQLLPGGDPAGRQRRAEPPGPHAEPPEVLHRVAEVGELPVEDRPQPVGTDEQVPEAEVAVHHAAARSAAAGSPPATGSPSSKAGCGSPSASSTSRYWATWSACAAARRPRRSGCGGPPPSPRRPGRRAGRAPSPTRRRAAACGRSSPPRAARPPCPALPSTDAVVGRHHPGHGHAAPRPPRGAAPPRSPCRCPCARRPPGPQPLQDQRPPVAARRRGRTTNVSREAPPDSRTSPSIDEPGASSSVSSAREVSRPRGGTYAEQAGACGRRLAGALTARGGSADRATAFSGGRRPPP